MKNIELKSCAMIGNRDTNKKGKWGEKSYKPITIIMRGKRNKRKKINLRFAITKRNRHGYESILAKR